MKYILITILYCFTAMLNAQGLIYIKDSSNQRERIPMNNYDYGLPDVTDSISLDTLPFLTEIDFAKYTPMNYQQMGGTCVAHAFSKAKAILVNKKINETDKAKKMANHFSPYYIYFNLTDPMDKNCAQGLNVETAAKFVLNYGIAPIGMVEYPDFYPFTQYCLGFPYPNHYPKYLTDDAKVASGYKFSKIYRLENMYDIKLALNGGMAVVVGMRLTEEFTEIIGKSYKFEFYHKTLDQGHAMVVVGYSDTMMGGAFKIANSWGEQWGDNGFVWIDYNSFLNMFLMAYGCSDDSELIVPEELNAGSVASAANNAVKRFSDVGLSLPLKDSSSAVGKIKISPADITELKKTMKTPAKYLSEIK